MSPTRKPKPPDKGAPPEHKPSRKVALEEVMRSLQDLVSNELATEPAPASGGAATPKKRRRTDRTQPAARADGPPAAVDDAEEVESITLEALPDSAPESVTAAKSPLPGGKTAPAFSALPPSMAGAGGLQQELPYLDPLAPPPESPPEPAAPAPPSSIPAAATAMDGGRSGLLPSRGITPSMEGRSAEREAVSERGLIHGTNAGAVLPPAETALTLSEENWDDIPVLEEAVDLSEEIDADVPGHGAPSPSTVLPPAAAARRLAIQVAARLNVELRKSGQAGLNSTIITQLAKMLEEALAKGAANMENTTARDGGSAEREAVPTGTNAGSSFPPTAKDGGSAGREAVPTGTNAGAVFRPPSEKH
jgi:hypothetical protein